MVLDTTGEFVLWKHASPPKLYWLTFRRFFTSPDGTETWNVYHATTIQTGSCDGNRYTAAQKVNWNADGSPDFGEAASLGTVLDGPSGEPST